MAYSSSNKENANHQQHQSSTTSAQVFSDNRSSTAANLQLRTMMANSPAQLQLQATAQTMAKSRAQPEHISETIQRAEQEELSQAKFETAQRVEDEETLQGKFTAESTTQLVEKPNDTGLPNQLKSGIESLSGMSMDHVKVHYNSDKPAQLNAHAYAQGSDIHVASGQEQHLAHEAWHVVQQAQGRVQPTKQMKRGIPVNDDKGLEQEADVMGAKALSLDTNNSSGQTQLKTLSSVSSNNSPIQGRFGFEVELPMLFLDKVDKNIVSLADGSNIAMDDVPRDAGFLAGETDLHNGPECHVNVDHSKTMNALFEGDLRKYAVDNALDDNERDSLLADTPNLMPHGISIVEVVTDAWDESTINRATALQKIRAVIAWINARYDQISGNQQAAMGNYFIGSDSAQSDAFQPRIGYFHSTYGVKLSQVPRLFQKTTEQKNRLARYAQRNLPQREHANNVMQTFNSIGAAKTALSAIKDVWPRTGAGTFTKGTKGWNNGSEAIFLGFLTLLDNYLLMFKANNGANLAKQMVGMHYYKSDLYDVARQLPNEILTELQTNAVLLVDTIDAIGESVGFGANDALGGPMGNMTLTQYLEQILTGNLGILRQQNGDDLRDPLLEGSINPYSRKLGPDLLGPNGNQEQGVVMENRHLEYLDPDYGPNLDASEAQVKQDSVTYGAPKVGPDTRNDDQKAMYDSIGARDEGPARRPIGEWEGIMIGIYDMISRINRR